MELVYKFDRAVRRAAPHAAAVALGGLLGFFVCYFAFQRPAVATEREATEAAVRALDEKTVEAGKHETRAQRLAHDIEQERAWKNQAARERDEAVQESYQVQRFNSGAWRTMIDGSDRTGVVEIAAPSLWLMPGGAMQGNRTTHAIPHGTPVTVCSIHIVDHFPFFEVLVTEGRFAGCRGWISYRLLDLQS